MPSTRADVELRLPADGAYASVLRTTAAGLAARLDFTLDDIEDLRMSVGEVIALVIPEAAEDGDLVTQFFLSPGGMEFQVSVPTPTRVELDEESFAWQVLTTLADDATADIADDRFTVRVRLTSALASGASV